MTNLISGKEALIALGSGKEVEYKSIDGWGDASLIHAFEFLDNNYEFRLNHAPFQSITSKYQHLLHLKLVKNIGLLLTTLHTDIAILRKVLE